MVFGLGFGVARASSGASNYDRNCRSSKLTIYTPVRGAETFFEATYQAQILRRGSFSPTSSISSTRRGARGTRPAAQKINNEWVIGLRATLTF